MRSRDYLRDNSSEVTVVRHSHGRPFRVLAGTLLAVSLGVACTSVQLPITDVVKNVDALFRGTITGYRDSGKGYKIAVLRVSRVWKGQIGQVAEISTFPGYSEEACHLGEDKLLDVGSDVIIFARKTKGQRQLVGYWASFLATAAAIEYLADLGPGQAPRGSKP